MPALIKIVSELRHPLAWWRAASALRKLDAATALLSLGFAVAVPSWWTVAGAVLAVALFAMDPANWLRTWVLRRVATARRRSH